MSRWRLVTRSLAHHWRAHVGVLLGVACAAAVLVGALVVGDSVRGSLREQALQRVGSFASVLAAGDRFVTDALAAVGLTRDDVGFWCSGSADYLTGAPFAFVSQLEATGAWPPVSESHVEMDGAWALYEAWVRLQHGDIDVAVVYAAGRSTAAEFTLSVSAPAQSSLLASSTVRIPPPTENGM